MSSVRSHLGATLAITLSVCSACHLYVPPGTTEPRPGQVIRVTLKAPEDIQVTRDGKDTTLLRAVSQLDGKLELQSNDSLWLAVGSLHDPRSALVPDVPRTSIEVRRTSALRTTLLVVGLAGGAIIIASAIAFASSPLFGQQ